MKQINLYSDGSSFGNPGPGGWGTILEYQGHLKELSGGELVTTNNRMELRGVIEGLKALKEPCEVHIVSDSTYVVKGINEWLSGWILNNWKSSTKKEIKNIELWKEYSDVSKKHIITATWVRGHSGHKYNERCDILARTQSEKFKNGENNE